MNISICMKLAGCVMILSGTSGYGCWLAGRYKSRLYILEQLRQMVLLFKGQIVYANATLEEAFRAVGERFSGSLAELFLRTADRISAASGETFAVLWQGEVQKLDPELALLERDRQSLEAIANHLGFMDREMQERNLLLYLEELDAAIQELKSQRTEKCRLYTCLGVMSGMFLSVLFL